MRSLLHFVRTTLVRGLFFLVPLVVLVIIIAKALDFVHRLTDPLAARFPLAAGQTPLLFAGGLLIIVCFAFGVLARTRPARAFVRWLESRILAKIPGYTFLKGAGESALGHETDDRYPLLLVRMRDSWQFAFLIEELEGGHLTVFIPGAPNPLSGSVFFMRPELVRRSDVPVAAALSCLRQLGAGSSKLLRDLEE